MRRELVIYPDDILKHPAHEVGEITDEIRDLCKEMGEMLFELNGEGLAAPQIGESLRIFVLLIEDKPMVFINPEIEKLGGKDMKVNEGCLSLPGVTASLHRQDQVTVKSLDIGGKEITLSLHGMEAVAVQHEMDHLDGIVVFDRMGTAQRHYKKKKYMKWYKKFAKQRKKNVRHEEVSDSEAKKEEADNGGVQDTQPDAEASAG